MNEELKATESVDFQEKLEQDFTEGLYSVLYKRINRNIVIEDENISNAFKRFSKIFEIGESFSVIDLISSAETVINGGEPDENAANVIFSYDYPANLPGRFGLKLLRNSFCGIHSLFKTHNGISVNLEAIGGSLAKGEAKRFLVIPKKKAEAIISKYRKYNINFVPAGEVIQSDKIIISEGSSVVASLDKSRLNNSSVSIKLDSSCMDAFVSGYRAVCTLVLCDKVSVNNVIKFGLGGRLEEVCARALGYFMGMMFLKPIASRIVFYSGNDATVAVQKPRVTDGDYLYLLKLRIDSFGMPDKSHYGQLFYYLSEKKKEGIIKDVLPVRENIDVVINRLCDDTCEYVSLSDIPENCYGIIVSVGRGESVNGMKLGYFKNIE